MSVADRLPEPEEHENYLDPDDVEVIEYDSDDGAWLLWLTDEHDVEDVTKRDPIGIVTDYSVEIIP